MASILFDLVLLVLFVLHYAVFIFARIGNGGLDMGYLSRVVLFKVKDVRHLPCFYVMLRKAKPLKTTNKSHRTHGDNIRKPSGIMENDGKP